MSASKALYPKAASGLIPSTAALISQCLGTNSCGGILVEWVCNCPTCHRASSILSSFHCSMDIVKTKRAPNSAKSLGPQSFLLLHQPQRPSSLRAHPPQLHYQHFRLQWPNAFWLEHALPWQTRVFCTFARFTVFLIQQLAQRIVSTQRRLFLLDRFLQSQHSQVVNRGLPMGDFSETCVQNYLCIYSSICNKKQSIHQQHVTLVY